MTPLCRRAGQTGFSMIELVIAVGVMATVMGAAFAVLHSGRSAWDTQPEGSDMQQRLRAAVASLQHDLAAAGAGPDVSGANALYDRLAPVLPYRWGAMSPDAPGTFRADVISILDVPRRPAFTRVIATSVASANETIVTTALDCGGLRQTLRCGFDAGQRVIVIDAASGWDTGIVTQAQDGALLVQHSAPWSSAYDDGSSFVTQLSVHTYYVETDRNTGVPQLMQYDGDTTSMPVVENVVSLMFQYWGDPTPPEIAAIDPPQTTYGPPPPRVGIASRAAWPDGENCTFAVVDGAHVPRLATLGAGPSPVPVPAATLVDGPWCPDDAHPARFDADLLRLRRIRVALRFQVAAAWLRGAAPALFMFPGTAGPARSVPDQEIWFDVAPRNLNLRRAWR
jgi:type II secretory pathway pseudopilin PulG